MAYRTISSKALYGPDSVGTSAAELCVESEALSGRTGIYIFNNDDSTEIYIGFDDDVSTENGCPIPAKGWLFLEMEPGQEVFAVAASSCNVRLIEV